MKKILFLISFLIMICGCATNQFKDNFNDEGLTLTLKKPKEVKLIETTNLQGKVLQYADMGYVVVGSSHFEGDWEGRTKAIKWAKKVGANLVIIGSQQTGTQEHHYTLAIPQVNTTYHQGSINTTGYHSGTFNSSAYAYGNVGGTRFNANAYGSGSYYGTSSYNTNYSGTSTSYSTSFVSGSYETAVFEQLAVFMVPREFVESFPEYPDENTIEYTETEEEIESL